MEIIKTLNTVKREICVYSQREGKRRGRGECIWISWICDVGPTSQGPRSQNDHSELALEASPFHTCMDERASIQEALSEQMSLRNWPPRSPSSQAWRRLGHPAALPVYHYYICVQDPLSHELCSWGYPLKKLQQLSQKPVVLSVWGHWSDSGMCRVSVFLLIIRLPLSLPSNTRPVYLGLQTNIQFPQIKH